MKRRVQQDMRSGRRRDGPPLIGLCARRCFADSHAASALHTIWQGSALKNMESKKSSAFARGQPFWRASDEPARNFLRKRRGNPPQSMGRGLDLPAGGGSLQTSPRFRKPPKRPSSASAAAAPKDRGRAKRELCSGLPAVFPDVLDVRNPYNRGTRRSAAAPAETRWGGSSPFPPPRRIDRVFVFFFFFPAPGNILRSNSLAARSCFLL